MTPARPGPEDPTQADRRARTDRIRRWNSVRQWTALSVAFVAWGCAEVSDPPVPSRIRMAVMPLAPPSVLQHRFEPLLRHLEREIGIPVDLVQNLSFDEIAEGLAYGDIHLAEMGTIPLEDLRRQGLADPLVILDTNVRTSAYFLVKAANPAKSLEAAAGATLSFGGGKSTSVHLMPRYFLLQQRNIVPEELYVVTYRLGHPDVLEYVASGAADIIVEASHRVEPLIASGALERAGVRVLWRTPTFASQAWGVRASLPEKVRWQIREAFLQLSTLDPLDAETLRRLRAERFLPAGAHELDRFDTVLRRLREQAESVPDR